jgi:hypothetical protein
VTDRQPSRFMSGIPFARTSAARSVLRLDPSQALVATRVSDSARLRNVLTVTTTDDDVALCVLFAANGNLERRVVSNVKMRQVGDACAKTHSMSPLDRPFIIWILNDRPR